MDAKNADPNAPLPPQNPSLLPDGKSQTSVDGVRPLDSESAAPRLQTSASEKKKKRTAPRSSIIGNVETASPVNDLRSAVQTSPLVEISRPDYNWFVPSFAYLFQVVHIMNEKMIELRSFGDRGTIQSWSPFTTVLYIAVVSIIQILRAQEIAGLITPVQLLFLQQFTTLYGLDKLPIPGPLVPFFRSMSLCSPGLGTYSDVSPAIPLMRFREQYGFNLETAQPNGAFTLASTVMLPHIPLIFDQYYRALTWILTTNTNTAKYEYSNWTMFTRIFNIKYADAATQLGTDPGQWLQFLTRNPCLSQRPSASDGLMNRHAQFMQNFSRYFPASWTIDASHKGDPTAAVPIPSSWTTSTDFLSFMGASQGMQWFGVVLQGMQEFCNHWQGNTSLLKIPPTTSTAGLILHRGISMSQLPTTLAFGSSPLSKATHRFTFDVKATSTSPFLTVEDVEDARVALVQTEYESTFTVDNEIPGAHDVTRFGPYWDIAPLLSESLTQDLTLPIMNVITSTSFFNAKGIA